MQGTQNTYVSSAYSTHWPTPSIPTRGVTLYILSALLLGPNSCNKYFKLTSLCACSYTSFPIDGKISCKNTKKDAIQSDKYKLSRVFKSCIRVITQVGAAVKFQYQNQISLYPMETSPYRALIASGRSMGNQEG